MSNIALVAINIYYNANGHNMLLNNNGVPLLYYWNKDNDSAIVDLILTDDNIKKIILANVTNISIYANTKISYICYTIAGIEEKFEETTKDLQEYITIDEIPYLIDSSIEEVAKSIYFDVFNAEYIERNNDPVIYDIYTKSNLINGEQITIQTFLNYMRSVLSKKYKLSNKNIEKIITKSGEIIDKTKKYHESN